MRRALVKTKVLIAMQVIAVLLSLLRRCFTPFEFHGRTLIPYLNILFFQMRSEGYPRRAVFLGCTYRSHAIDVVNRGRFQFSQDLPARIKIAVLNVLSDFFAALSFNVEERHDEREEQANIVRSVDSKNRDARLFKVGLAALDLIDFVVDALACEELVYSAEDEVVPLHLHDLEKWHSSRFANGTFAIKESSNVFPAHWSHGIHYSTMLIAPGVAH